MGERRWLLAATACCTVAIAGPPPAPETAHPPPPLHESQPQGAQESQQGVPDEDFIEFLGADDVGDDTWWEFLQKPPPRRENPHAAPAQEEKP